MDGKRDNKVTIKIPRPLYNNLKLLIKDSGFNSVNDFIVYILRNMASNNKIDIGDKRNKKEIETIKERLKNLGYLS